MGGIEIKFDFVEALRGQPNVYFIIPGGFQDIRLTDNLVLLPHHSVFFHPDLVNASDGVVGKLGYSTLAEVYHAGIPFGYILRPHFRESEYLARYVEKHMSCLDIKKEDFQTGLWINQVPELLNLPRTPPLEANGAQQVAGFLCDLLES